MKTSIHIEGVRAFKNLSSAIIDNIDHYNDHLDGIPLKLSQQYEMMSRCLGARTYAGLKSKLPAVFTLDAGVTEQYNQQLNLTEHPIHAAFKLYASCSDEYNLMTGIRYELDLSEIKPEHAVQIERFMQTDQWSEFTKAHFQAPYFTDNGFTVNSASWDTLAGEVCRFLAKATGLIEDHLCDLNIILTTHGTAVCNDFISPEHPFHISTNGKLLPLLNELIDIGSGEFDDHFKSHIKPLLELYDECADICANYHFRDQYLYEKYDLGESIYDWIFYCDSMLKSIEGLLHSFGVYWLNESEKYEELLKYIQRDQLPMSPNTLLTNCQQLSFEHDMYEIVTFDDIDHALKLNQVSATEEDIHKLANQVCDEFFQDSYTLMVTKVSKIHGLVNKVFDDAEKRKFSYDILMPMFYISLLKNASTFEFDEFTLSNSSSKYALIHLNLMSIDRNLPSTSTIFKGVIEQYQNFTAEDAKLFDNDLRLVIDEHVRMKINAFVYHNESPEKDKLRIRLYDAVIYRIFDYFTTYDITDWVHILYRMQIASSVKDMV